MIGCRGGPASLGGKARKIKPAGCLLGVGEVLLGVGKTFGQLHPYARPVKQHLPLAIMGMRLRARHQSWPRARGARSSTVLPGTVLTTVFPITRGNTSCRISRACARSPPSC